MQTQRVAALNASKCLMSRLRSIWLIPPATLPLRSLETERESFCCACCNISEPFGLRSSICYTGGDDCIVRLWKTDEGEDQEPPTAIEAGESIMTLAASVRSLVLSFTSR